MCFLCCPKFFISLLEYQFISIHLFIYRKSIATTTLTMTEPEPKQNNRGLLYSAYHKLYNALSSLEKFEKGTNFFDNISHLDIFFSEYRNVTFMIQKSLAHTEFLAIYEENRKKYLLNDVCKWFIDKRNEVLKQQPFDLEKRIHIVIYTTTESHVLPELSFTIENDVEYSTLVESMHDFLTSFHLVEVMFSAEFSFYENGHSEDLYDNFISGINNMKLFMKAMKNALNENCTLSDQLEQKIDGLKFHRIPKNMLLVDDYVFYTRTGEFEKASRVELSLGTASPKAPVAGLDKLFPECKNVFKQFVMMHLIIYQQQRRIMPTFFALFSDQTMQFMSFDSSIKTTVYRKLYEVANRIEKEEIVDVMYVGEMYGYADRQQIINMEARERIEHATSELLVFFKTDQELNTRSYAFDTAHIDDMEYIISVLDGADNQMNKLAFMIPVINEFERLHQKRQG